MSQRIGISCCGLTRVWHHVDVAEDKRTLGRLASAIAIVLQGKHKPVYSPNRDHGDYVVVSNCQHLKVTGKKMKQKTYWSHTTRPGSLRMITMEQMAQNKGFKELLKRAVKNMLPRNTLRFARMERLKVFDGDEHPYKQNLIAFADEMGLVRERIKNLEEREKTMKQVEKRLKELLDE